MHADVVRLGHAGLPVVETVEFLKAGVCDFAHVFTDLDFGDNVSVPVLHGAELVHAAEYRRALGGDEPLAHAESVDLRALAEQLGDEPLVQRVGDGDGAVRPARLVQHDPGLLGQIGHIAGVKTDAALGDAHGLEHLVEGADSVGDARFQGVKGVHQQHRVGGIGLAVSDKGVVLRVEHLYPGVGHGPCGGNAVDLVGNGAGGTCAAADKGGPGSGHGAGDALGPAGTEFQHGAAVSRPADAVGLGGDQALVVKLQQQIGLQQLGLNGRGADSKDRFPGEDRRALRHGPDVAGKLEIPQVVEKGLVKDASAPEIVNVLLVKVQILNIVDDLLQPGRNGEAAAVRYLPEEYVKIGHAILHTAHKVAVAHCKLVKIAQHGQIDAVSAFHALPPVTIIRKG